MKSLIVYQAQTEDAARLDSLLAVWIADAYLRRVKTERIHLEIPQEFRPNFDMYYSQLDIHLLGGSYSSDYLAYWRDLGYHLTVISNTMPEEEMLKLVTPSNRHRVRHRIDGDRSLSGMAWQHYFPNDPTPRFILLLGEALGSNPSSDSKEFYEAVVKQGINFSTFDSLIISGDKGIQRLIELNKPVEPIKLEVKAT